MTALARSTRLFELVLGLVVVGAFATAAGLALAPTCAARQWSQTQCTIVGSRAVEVESPEGHHWNVLVSWTYRVGAVDYRIEDADPAIFGLAHDREGAEATAARYRVGETIPCHYAPEAPHRSTLDRSAPPWREALTAGAVAVALLAGAGLVARWLRARRAR